MFFTANMSFKTQKTSKILDILKFCTKWFHPSSNFLFPYAYGCLSRLHRIKDNISKFWGCNTRNIGSFLSLSISYQNNRSHSKDCRFQHRNLNEENEKKSFRSFNNAIMRASSEIMDFLQVLGFLQVLWFPPTGNVDRVG